LISASGFQFKGSGWYVTDYARKGNGGDSEAPKETTEKKESTAKADTSGTESTKKATGKSRKSSD
jgi:predicted nucleic acid-binding Zn ribbon protein